MTYYNPRVYNYSNLREEDKLFVKHAFIILAEIECMKDDYKTDNESTIIERILFETGEEVITEVHEHVIHFLIEYIVSTIDCYEGVVNEIDTDDYFYGIDME